MNPGLVWLLRRAPGAWLRSLGRKARGPRRLLLLAGAGFVLFLVVAGQVASWGAHEDDPAQVASRLDTARLVAPMAITLFVLLIDLSGRGLYFRPAEIDFLFPAPVPRRDLLLYQVTSRAGMAALSGLWTAIFVVRWAGTPGGGVVAALLTMVWFQLVSQVLSVAAAALGERLAPRARVALWCGVVLLVAVGARSALVSLPADAPPGESFEAFATSPWVVAATFPAQPFARLFAAATYADAALWTLVCAAEMGVMLLALVRLDVAYEEAAIASSRRMQERLRRIRSGEGAFLPSAGSAQRRRVPVLPRLGGVGPVARRQLLEVFRNPASVLWTAASVLLCAGLIVVAGRRRGDEGEALGASVAAAVVAVALTTFASQGFTFDFRRDLDRMAEWKVLPLRPLAVAAGQLVVPALVFTFVQGVALSLVLVVGDLPPWTALLAAAVLPLWNWLSAALDNTLFLLFPYRIAAEDTARVPFIGKMLLTTLLKSVAVGVVALTAAVPVAAGVAVGGAGVWAGAAAGWFVLAVAALASTGAVAWAYRGFDPSRDV